MQIRIAVGGVAIALLLAGFLAGPAVFGGPVALDAQVRGPGPDGRWPLQPRSPGNRYLAPFMEGWYANEDGTFSISFGYLNANQDTIRIPVGPDNFIEPAQFNGMQPTVFEPGHERGLFTVELPAAMADTDVWWTLRKPNGDEARVPGRIGAVAYQLDWYPRPHGSMHPLVSFDGQEGEGRGPTGLLAQRIETVSVGDPVTLSVNARDPSERDESDFRFQDAIPINVTWSQLQGPGTAVFTRHESNPLPEVEEEEQPDSAAIAAAIAARGGGGGGGGAAAAAAAFAGRGGRGGGRPPPPQNIRLPEGSGTGAVIVTFTEPGEYLMRASVDNFSAPDSSGGDQCCWTNAYIRVNVTP